MQLKMPNPCPEKWDKMSPTENGANCDKCKIEVLDFTNKTPEEIKTILQERKGQKTCARVHPIQMHNLGSDYYLWQNQNSKTFRSKFLLACVLVFGITLFSGCDPGSIFGPPEVGEPSMDVGKVEVGTVAEDTTINNDEDLYPFQGEISTDEFDYPVGKVVSDEE